MIRILNERGDLKPEKIHGCSIIKDLEEAIKKDTSMGLDETDIQNLYRDLISSSLEKVTNVPHFTYNDVEHYGNQIYSYDRKPHEIFCAFDDFSLQAARAWALCTTNEALKLLQK